MWLKITDALKRYSGYTRFISPAWLYACTWTQEHPKTATAALVILTVTQFV
jgi:hypothetical protein